MDRIIAAVDDRSESCRRPLGGRRSPLLGGPLALVHVVDDEWGTISNRMVSEVSTSAERLLETELAYALSLEEDLAVTAMLLEGSPMWELSRLSTADTLIAVGTHKSGFHYGAPSAPAAFTCESPIRIHRHHPRIRRTVPPRGRRRRR